MSFTRIYMICIGFIVKIPLYQRFHNFFNAISHLFSHLIEFTFVHYSVYLSATRIYMVSYWKFILYRQFHNFLSKFHTLFYTFFKRFFALKVFSFIPNFYKKFRKIKWIIPEIRFKKANRGYLLTIFCHFWTKKLFFLKIRPSHFLE